MKPQRMNLDSEALTEFREALSAAIEIVTCQLEKKGMQEGVVSAKVKITMHEVTDEKTGEIYHMVGIEPDVKMKIGTGDGIKCSKRGVFVMKTDRHGRPMIASNQITIDELEQEGA